MPCAILWYDHDVRGRYHQIAAIVYIIAGAALVLQARSENDELFLWIGTVFIVVGGLRGVIAYIFRQRLSPGTTDDA